jgi:hypothetical protein
MSFQRATICVLGACIWLIASFASDARAGTLRNDVVFSDTSGLSANTELARRLLSPLTAAQLPQLLARSNASLSQQPVDISRETFVVYIPSAPPPARGYALIVFVPPWNTARLPEGWDAVLDQYGAIFVSAARSGNDASVLGRREPLALLAEQNVVHHYPVDPNRVYVSGFSGGSRIAMRLALAYPDIFHGAILDAGGDPIGNATIPLPPKDLFTRFQESSHLVYVTGDRDMAVLSAASASMHSMHEWCQFNTDNHVAPSAGHTIISTTSLARALDALSVPARPDADRLAACRAGIESELSTQLQQVESLMAAGNRDGAQKLLNDIDARFGGLAAPRSIDLESRLGRN